LDQQYQDGQHTIGRFRISVTTAPRPINLDGLPKNIVEILALAGDQRSEQQGRIDQILSRPGQRTEDDASRRWPKPASRGRSIRNWNSCASG
jgi:hypothetical protein